MIVRLSGLQQRPLFLSLFPFFPFPLSHFSLFPFFPFSLFPFFPFSLFPFFPFSLFPFFPFSLFPFFPFSLFPFFPFSLLPFFPSSLLPFFPSSLLPFFPFSLFPFFLFPFLSFPLPPHQESAPRRSRRFRQCLVRAGAAGGELGENCQQSVRGRSRLSTTQVARFHLSNMKGRISRNLKNTLPS